MGPILAVDPGSRRLGLAISDPGRSLAFPREVVAFEKIAEAVKAVKRLVAEEGVELIVVGLPLSLSGREGPAVEKARDLARRLREATGVEVVEWDERLTTVGAARAMHEGGLNSRQQRGRVDQVAAALLLQTYLEAIRGQG
ncbi:MAG: Holliday junction resolvase RuvX [Candidatus Riflebacteria bacterium]|nr:Holliday junction resolvase RuvX [Candidatus Riflebacteria bacterium]